MLKNRGVVGRSQRIPSRPPYVPPKLLRLRPVTPTWTTPQNPALSAPPSLLSHTETNPTSSGHNQSRSPPPTPLSLTFSEAPLPPSPRSNTFESDVSEADKLNRFSLSSKRSRNEDEAPSSSKRKAGDSDSVTTVLPLFVSPLGIPLSFHVLCTGYHRESSEIILTDEVCSMRLAFGFD